MTDRKRVSGISLRNNIIHKITTDYDVIIFEDHRSVINVLYHLFEQRKYKEPLDVVMFDYHDDYCQPTQETLKKLYKFLKKPSKEELNKIVEYDLNPLDDDWVKVGMELGLIGNVFLFNAEQTFIGFREDYRTKNFGTKYLYNVGNVWAALGYHGILNDPIKSEYQQLWDDFGWELNEGKFHFKEGRKKFIFDIDLDCFSTRVLDKTIAIPEEILIPKLTEYGNSYFHYYSNSQEFMKELIKDSEVVTLCFENDCCGGIRQAYKIFNMVDEIFFDNQLGE